MFGVIFFLSLFFLFVCLCFFRQEKAFQWLRLNENPVLTRMCPSVSCGGVRQTSCKAMRPRTVPFSKPFPLWWLSSREGHLPSSHSSNVKIISLIKVLYMCCFHPSRLSLGCHLDSTYNDTCKVEPGGGGRVKVNMT